MIGLEGASLPKLIGLCADDPPPEAMGTAGYERYVRRNWAGIVEWQHKGEDGSFVEPESVEEVQALVRAHSKVRVLGKGHCFPALCDGGGSGGEVVLSLLGNMCKILSLDLEANTVTVQGGTTYSQLTRFLLRSVHNELPISHVVMGLSYVLIFSWNRYLIDKTELGAIFVLKMIEND